GARRVLVVGTGPLANLIGGLITTSNHSHVLAGYVGCPRDSVVVPNEHIVDGGGIDISETARREHAEKIVISITERRGSIPLKDLMHCKFSGIDVFDAPTFYEQLTGKLLLENITPGWFVFSNGFKLTHTIRFCKKIIDKILATIGLIITFPLFPLIAVAVKISSPGPVFFKQVRTGLHEKQFLLYKFRTMRSDAEAGTGAVWAQDNDPRVTSIGKFLRKSRLDELPQLYNVLKGDMSFIGPRPERPEFVETLKQQIPYYSHRHFVKPGITGWAQIKYPYGASVEDAVEKLRYDLYYIKNLSITLDLLIFFETIKVILFSRGGR
nr:TIGR03013 family PEP-CTERM/XrtA system glycosyltransferase [Geobacteraceae bacterium]